MTILGVDSPGPHRYEPMRSFDNLSQFKSYGAVKIATGNPKSDVDWAVYRSSSIPSAAEYNPNDSYSGPSGGQFSTAFVPGTLDWVEYFSKQIPGPGDYYPKDQKRKVGFKISSANPKSDVEWSIYRAKQIPGPGAYDLQDKCRPNGARVLGRFVRGGNTQTTLPDAIQYSHSTVNPHGPNQCREEGSIGKQSNSEKKTMPGFYMGAKTRQDKNDYLLMCDDEKEWRMEQRKKLARKKRRALNAKLETLGPRNRHFGWDPLKFEMPKDSFSSARSQSAPSITTDLSSKSLSAMHSMMSTLSKRSTFDGKKRKTYKHQTLATNRLSKPTSIKRLPTLTPHAALMRLIEENRGQLPSDAYKQFGRT